MFEYMKKIYTKYWWDIKFFEGIIKLLIKISVFIITIYSSIYFCFVINYFPKLNISSIFSIIFNIFGLSLFLFMLFVFILTPILGSSLLILIMLASIYFYKIKLSINLLIFLFTVLIFPEIIISLIYMAKFTKNYAQEKDINNIFIILLAVIFIFYTLGFYVLSLTGIIIFLIEIIILAIFTKFIINLKENKTMVILYFILRFFIVFIFLIFILYMFNPKLGEIYVENLKKILSLPFFVTGMSNIKVDIFTSKSNYTNCTLIWKYDNEIVFDYNGSRVILHTDNYKIFYKQKVLFPEVKKFLEQI